MSKQLSAEQTMKTLNKHRRAGQREQPLEMPQYPRMGEISRRGIIS